MSFKTARDIFFDIEPITFTVKLKLFNKLTGTVVRNL